MGIQSRAPGTARRWTPEQDDAATRSPSPSPAQPPVKAVPLHATVPPPGLHVQRRASRASASASPPPRRPLPLASTLNSEAAIAKVQAARRLKQLHQLARAKQHDAAMRLRQHALPSLQNAAMASETGWMDERDAPAAMGLAAPVGNEPPIWPGARELGAILRAAEAGGAAAPAVRRSASVQLLRLIGGAARQQRLSFEGVALQSLLDDLAVRDEAVEPGSHGITRAMLVRARAVASASGLTPIAQRRLAALVPGASVARRAMVEAAFEGLVQSAAEGGEISADGVLSVVHDAMTNAGLRSAHGFSPAQTQSFVNGLQSRHPASVGVLGMGWMVEQALAQADRHFGQSDVLAAISAALGARVPANAHDVLARPDPVAIGLRQVLGDIRLGVGESQPLGPMLRLVLAQIEGLSDVSEASHADLRAALPRLRETLDDIAATAPSVEEAFVLRELLDRIGVPSSMLSATLAPSELDMAAYRGLGRQQRQLDAGLAHERGLANLWNAIERGSA